MKQLCVFLFSLFSAIMMPLALPSEACDASDTKFQIYTDTSIYEFSEDEVFEESKCSELIRQSNLEKKRKYARQLEEMGLDAYTKLNYLFPGAGIHIEEVLSKIKSEAKNASIYYTDNKTIVEDEEIGRRVSSEQVCKSLLEKLKNNEKLSAKIEIEEIKPEITSEDLIKLSHVRSKFITDICGTNQEGRKNNIKVALASFNGLKVEHGEKISFNEIIGDTTQQKGYLPAKIIVNGKYKDEYGGGVCQAATTLYNSLILAGIEVLEANPHSLRVGYVLPSFDAMVAGGISDLVFRNNTGGPIYIFTGANSSECFAVVCGLKNNYTIKWRSEVLDKKENDAENINFRSEGYLEYYLGEDLVKTKKNKK